MQDKLHDFSLNLQAVQNYFVPHLGGLCSEDSSSFKNANYTIVLKFFLFFGRCSNPGYVNSYFMNSCKSLKTYDFIHSFPLEYYLWFSNQNFTNHFKILEGNNNVYCQKAWPHSMDKVVVLYKINDFSGNVFSV